VGEPYIHVTHNPIGGAALTWLHELCFRDQSQQEFYQQTIPAAKARSSEVVLDPPFLGGDRLEIEACRAAFHHLTLATDRLDLLATLLQTMHQKHHEALAALGMGDRFQRVFLTGGGAEIIQQLIPEYAVTAVQPLEEGSLKGVARLFARQ
jgi:sugar (pentulose or hexulose) kinase